MDQVQFFGWNQIGKASNLTETISELAKLENYAMNA